MSKNKIFYVKAFKSYPLTDKQTGQKLYNKALRGWSKTAYRPASLVVNYDKRPQFVRFSTGQ